MGKKTDIKRVQALISSGALNDSVVMECEIENVFSDFHLSVFKEMERGDKFKVFIAVFDGQNRWICGDTFDLSDIANSHFRLQALTNKFNEVISEAKKIIKE